jgi:HD-GYP domain-containing protein (c-di-GMP phosphodiesterase class II)
MGLAQTLEVFYSQQGLTAAIDIAHERRGSWFDPVLVDAFLAIRDNNEFWRMVARPEPHLQVSQYEPTDEIRTADEAQLDRIAESFAAVVDAKSPWTYRHSTGVADIAVGIAEVLGHTQQELRTIRRMGLLHDVGKLGVSNLILDKPGKLDEREFEALKLHTHHTHSIVGRVKCLHELAHLAAAHHEKLNGRGYHRGIPSGELPISARLLAVADIYEALSAARPYRDGLPQEKILAILESETGTGICAESYAALRTWLERREVQTRIGDQLHAVEKLVDEL